MSRTSRAVSFMLGICPLFAFLQYTRVGRLLFHVHVPFRFQASGKLQKGLPLILYSVVIFSVAFLSCTLPDTTKKRLPDQVKNIEQPGSVMLYVAKLFITYIFSFFICDITWTGIGFAITIHQHFPFSNLWLQWNQKISIVQRGNRHLRLITKNEYQMDSKVPTSFAYLKPCNLHDRKIKQIFQTLTTNVCI